jgi:hypothetical protein
MASFVELEARLRELVRERQPSNDERNAPEFRAARLRAGSARSEAFQRATQGKGKPGARSMYGAGKPPSSS